MRIGYARVSKADGSQSLDLQLDALREAGVTPDRIYQDKASGTKLDRPGLQACLKALQPGNTLVVWKYDRLSRKTKDIYNLADALHGQGVVIEVLAGPGSQIDTSTAMGKAMFGMFSVVAELERDQISERTKAGLAAARARGRKGGRKKKMTEDKIKIAMAALSQPDCDVQALLKTLGVGKTTLYAHVAPDGSRR